MPARKSVAAKDHTGESLFGPWSHPSDEPDGAPARIYNNQGNGLSEVAGQNYNEALGRVSTAHTVGGDSHDNRSASGYAPGAPGSKTNTSVDLA